MTSRSSLATSKDTCRAPLFRSAAIRREPRLSTGHCLFPGGAGIASGAPAASAGLLNGTESAAFGRLPDTTWVYPGRGRDTTVGAERPHLPKWRGRGRRPARSRVQAQHQGESGGAGPMPGQTGPRAAERTLEVLELVADAAGPVSAKALARSLGCALSTVYTLLTPLTERGYLVRADGGYVLGYRVPALHRSFQKQTGLDEGIVGLLTWLQRATRASANYVAFQGNGLVIADVRTVAAQGAERPRIGVGIDPRSHAYAYGKVALAAASPAARRRYLEELGLRRFTPYTIASVTRLDEELRRVRRLGFAQEVEEAQPGLACLAAPVLGAEGTVVGCVALSARPDELRANRSSLIDAVRRAAQKATQVSHR